MPQRRKSPAGVELSFRFLLSSFSVSLCLCGFLSGPLSLAEQPVEFARDVEPILRTACFPCHGAAAAQGELRLDARDAALKGGASGPALVPGHAADSLLLKRVSGQVGTRMPMGLAPLTEAQVATVRAWIDQGAAWGAPSAAGAAGSIDFTAQIQPIFKANCIRCHGPDQQKSQLRLDSRTNALKGGLSGRVILPGKAKDSLLIRHLLGQEKPRMPFEGAPLPDAQIALIRAWIDAGAPGPNDAVADAKVARHWAYVKPERPTVPAGQERGVGPEPDRRVHPRAPREGGPRSLARSLPRDAPPAR